MVNTEGRQPKQNSRKPSFISSNSSEATFFIFTEQAQKELELSTNTAYKSTVQPIVNCQTH